MKQHTTRAELAAQLKADHAAMIRERVKRITVKNRTRSDK